MKSFSIITPVYNGQEYIANCINAIANANYDLSKIEHIVVDDGSTDSTKEICERLAKKYPHVKFYSKENGNWGSVINFVKNKHLVHNDYVVLCDADDILLPNCFETVNRKNNGCDLFVSSFYRWNGKKRKIKIFPYFFLFKRNLYKKYEWHYHTSLIVPQSGWMKKDIFYKIEDLKEGVAYQDTVLFTQAFLHAKHIRYTTKGTSLYWCVRPGNSMSESKAEQGLAKLVSNFDYYADQKWIHPFVYYAMGLKKIRKYLKKHNLKYDFSGQKMNFTGFPFYIRPVLWILYLMLVKKFVKK